MRATEVLESAFTLAEKVKAILNVTDTWGNPITYVQYHNKTDSNALHEDLTHITVHAEYTAKKEEDYEILGELKAIQHKVYFGITTQLKQLGYEIIDHKITIEDIEGQLKNYEYGCECGFSAPCFILKMDKKAYKMALERISLELRQQKAQPKYYSAVKQTFNESEADNIATLSFEEMKVIGINPPLKAFNSLAFNLDRLSIGSTIPFTDVKYVLTDTPVVAKKKIPMEAIATLTYKGEELKAIVNCHSQYLEVGIWDAQGSQHRELLVRETLDHSFLSATKAQMKKMLNNNLVKGTKITDFNVTMLNHKFVFSNFVRFNSISIVIPDYSKKAWTRGLITLTVKKSGEIMAYNMNGELNAEATEYMSKHIGTLDSKTLKTLFCSNRRFAFKYLTTLIGKEENSRDYKLVLF